jgi:hypothetical protein
MKACTEKENWNPEKGINMLHHVAFFFFLVVGMCANKKEEEESNVMQMLIPYMQSFTKDCQ